MRENEQTDGRTDGRSAPTEPLDGSSRTSSSLVPFDGLSSPGFYGYREEPRSRSGRSLGTAKHRSTHFAALRLLLIIYAASAAPLPTPVVVGTRVLRAGTIRIGIIARVPMPETGRTGPILSRAAIDSPGIIIMIGFPGVLGAGLSGPPVYARIGPRCRIKSAGLRASDHPRARRSSTVTAEREGKKGRK